MGAGIGAYKLRKMEKEEKQELIRTCTVEVQDDDEAWRKLTEGDKFIEKIRTQLLARKDGQKMPLYDVPLMIDGTNYKLVRIVPVTPPDKHNNDSDTSTGPPTPSLFPDDPPHGHGSAEFAAKKHNPK